MKNYCLLILLCLPVITWADVGSTVEVGFSPEGTAEDLVLKVIDSAQHDIKLAGYSFTSAKVVRGLLNARRRGVAVALVVDEKNNIGGDSSGKARSALSALLSAGSAVRLNGSYAIHHDKYILVDAKHVETGSYNYSAAAANRNSENVLVIWNNKELASRYLNHWQVRFDEAREYKLAY